MSRPILVVSFVVSAIAVWWLATNAGEFGKTVLAIIAAIAPLAVTKLWEQRVTIEQHLREKKVPMYEHMIDSIFRIIQAEKPGFKKVSPDQMVKDITQFTSDAMIWASSDVIRAWVRFRHIDWSSPAGVLDGTHAIEDLFRAMRTDLGNDVSSLKNHEIIKLMINDYDTWAQTKGLAKPKDRNE